MGSSGPRQPRTHRSVFLSSTSRDLATHRQQVIDTLLRMSLFPVAMEQFGAQGSGDATSVSTDKVAEADIYVGIFAWRYGYVPPGETRSVTHLEYLEARKLGLPCYLFLAHAETQHDDTLFPTSLRDPDHLGALLAFRDELQLAVVDYFTTPDDLARKVATALVKERGHEVRAGPRPPRDLPPPNVSFVGREQEVRDIAAALRQGKRMALAAAVSGMGGVGKSALAAEVAHVLAAEPDAFPGGIAFVRCDERRDLPGVVWVYDQLLADWNSPLTPQELGEATTPEAEAELRERALRARLRLAGNEPLSPALVLLDNVEREFPLQRALETLAALSITVLLTTRTEFHLPRLSLYKLEVLAPAAALTLLQQRYADLGGTWHAARDDAPAVAIVSALGSLPLALELAAPRAAEIGLETLAKEVQQGTLAPLQDVLDAKRSVGYLLSKSLSSLMPTQQARFATLGLPAGPDWPRPVIEQLVSAVGALPTEAAPANTDLSLLARLSLIKLVPPEAPDEAPRVRLHPLLRELAREAWAKQPGDIQRLALEALLEGVGTLVENDARDFGRLKREEEMIVGTLRQAAEAHLAQLRLIEVIGALVNYLMIGGHWRLGMELLPLQREACREVGNRAGEGITLSNLGSLADNLGRKEEAARYYEQALLIHREVGDRVGEGTVLNNLGKLAVDRGRKEEAARYYEQALLICREVDNRSGEGTTLNNLGKLAVDRGRKEEAARYYEQALLIHREVGNHAVEGITLNNLGSLADGLGRKEEAARYYEQALLILREVGDRAGEGIALNNLGSLADDLGRKEEAARYYEQALLIHREVGDRAGEGNTLNNLGKLAKNLGRQEEAARHYEQALLIRREVGDRSGEAYTLNNLGTLAYQRGEVEMAVQYLQQALAICEEIGAVDLGRLVRENLAAVEQALGKRSKHARRPWWQHKG